MARPLKADEPRIFDKHPFVFYLQTQFQYNLLNDTIKRHFYLLIKINYMKYLFEWTPAISVNNEIIDAQHQRLLGQVNILLSYIIAEKNDEIVVEAVHFLDKYISEHFTYEEQYMAEHKFPEIDVHIKYHKDFADHYQSFKDKLDSGISRESLALEIEQYVGNWWLEHIGKADKKYADYIKQHEL